MANSQPRAPPLHINLVLAIKRDYLDGPHDPSTYPFLRAFALGYVTEVGPSLLKILLSSALSKGKNRQALTTILRNSFKSILHGFSIHGLAFFFGIAMGGAKWLERIFLPLVTRFYTRRLKSRSLEDGKAKLEREDLRQIQGLTTFLSSTVASLLGLLLFQSSPVRRHYRKGITANPLPIERDLNEMVKKLPIDKPPRESPTLNLTLFMLVRAADSLVRGTYAAFPQADKGLMKVLANQADTLIFWLSCWRIMWCWFYAPHRLPRSYVNWITRLSRMDTRLLNLLRHARIGEWAYGQEPQGAARELGPNIAIAMGHPPSSGNPAQITALSCELVHGKTGNSASCEVNTLRRWYIGWLESMLIYLPVHAIPTVLFNRRKLGARPLRTVLATLLGAARSSAFLATFIASVWGFVCLGRTRLFPKLLPFLPQQFWDGGAAPMLGCLACGLSVLIENKRRRGEMALYVAPRALYAIMDEVLPAWFFTGSAGLFVSKWTERMVFALSNAVVTTAAVHRPELVRGVVKGVMLQIVGKEWKET